MPRNKASKSIGVVDVNSLGFENSYNLHNRDQKVVVIMLSDLKLKLTQYKQNVLNRQLAIPFLSIVAYWVPAFTSDFKEFIGLSPETVKGGYLVLGLIVSLQLTKNALNYLKVKIVSFFPRIRIRVGYSILQEERMEHDPVKFAEILCDETDRYGGA
jgi:hypothetical protein